MGRISALSALAGALSAFAAWQVLIVIAGAVGVGIHGSTSFATVSAGQFKAIAAIIVAAALFVAFMFGGYVSGRMSRRSGAVHGLLAGIIGAFVAAIAVAVVIRTGTDNGLASVARHIQVADTWNQWRYFGLIGIAVAAGAMVLGGLAGGVEGERWHGKLLARAVDPAYGPEAVQRAEAAERMRQAEVARLAAADHVGRLTSAGHTARTAAVSGNTETTEPVPAGVEAGPATVRVPARRWSTADRSAAGSTPDRTVTAAADGHN